MSESIKNIWEKTVKMGEVYDTVEMINDWIFPVCAILVTIIIILLYITFSNRGAIGKLKRKMKLMEDKMNKVQKNIDKKNQNESSVATEKVCETHPRWKRDDI